MVVVRHGGSHGLWLVVVVVCGGGSGGGGLGCGVEQIECGKRFGDVAGHVIDCGYLMAQFVQPSVGR